MAAIAVGPRKLSFDGRVDSFSPTGGSPRFTAVLKGGAWEPALRPEADLWMMKTEPRLLNTSEVSKSKAQTGSAGPRQRGILPSTLRRLNSSNSASALPTAQKKAAHIRAKRVPAVGGRHSNYPIHWNDSLPEAFEVLHGNRLRREHQQRLNRGAGTRASLDGGLRHSRSQGYISTRTRVIPGELGTQHAGNQVHDQRAGGFEASLSYTRSNLPVYLQSLVPGDPRLSRAPSTSPAPFTFQQHQPASATSALLQQHQPASALLDRAPHSQRAGGKFAATAPGLIQHHAPGPSYIDHSGLQYDHRLSLDDRQLHLTKEEKKAERHRIRMEEARNKRMHRQMMKSGEAWAPPSALAATTHPPGTPNSADGQQLEYEGRQAQQAPLEQTSGRQQASSR